MNLGKWISDRYNNDESTQKRFAKAHHESEITMIYHALEMSKLSRLWIDWDRWQVMLDFFALPEVTSRVAARGSALPILTTCPVSSRKNVYMHPYMFSMDESAKFGADGKFPSNVQIRAHFGSVVTRGFESERVPRNKVPEITSGGSGTPNLHNLLSGWALQVGYDSSNLRNHGFTGFLVSA